MKINCFNPSFTMEYLRSLSAEMLGISENLFQSFFYNGIPTKWLVTYCYWDNRDKFQSFFYNGIPTKRQLPAHGNVVNLVSILLLQWNTYEGRFEVTERIDFKSFNPSFTMEYLRRMKV